jgi:type I restriction enzyme R subunit
MSTTDTSEKGLETLIMRHMTGTDGLAAVADGVAAETPDAISAAKAAGSGWLAGNPRDYDRTHALDAPHLFQFLLTTQPEALKKLAIVDYKDAKDINRQKFLARLSNDIGKRGVIDVLRKGVDHGPLHFDLFYGTPSPGNTTAAALFAKNRFTVTRQLRYSADETRRALDLGLFIPLFFGPGMRRGRGFEIRGKGHHHWCRAESGVYPIGRPAEMVVQAQFLQA